MRPVYREPLFQIPAYACDISISYSISDDAQYVIHNHLLYTKGNQISNNCDNQDGNEYIFVHTQNRLINLLDIHVHEHLFFTSSSHFCIRF